MKRWIHSSEDITAGIGSGRRTIYYIGTYPDREQVHIDGYKTSGFASMEEAQAALDELYQEEYFQKKYPNLQALHRFAYNVYHD